MSIRELGRNVADVFDDVELERIEVIVTRNGREVALLSPVESRDGIRPTGNHRRPRTEETDEE